MKRGGGARRGACSRPVLLGDDLPSLRKGKAASAGWEAGVIWGLTGASPSRSKDGAGAGAGDGWRPGDALGAAGDCPGQGSVSQKTPETEAAWTLLGLSLSVWLWNCLLHRLRGTHVYSTCSSKFCCRQGMASCWAGALGKDRVPLLQS